MARRRLPAQRRPAGRIGAVLALLAAAAGGGAEPELRNLPGTRAEAATLIVQGVDGGSLTLAALALL